MAPNCKSKENHMSKEGKKKGLRRNRVGKAIGSATVNKERQTTR